MGGGVRADSALDERADAGNGRGEGGSGGGHTSRRMAQAKSRSKRKVHTRPQMAQMTNGRRSLLTPPSTPVVDERVDGVAMSCAA